MEDGQLRLTRKGFSLNAVCETVADMFRVASEEKGLTLSFCVEPSVPDKLIGDDDRIIQILFNLVGNAIKFTASGSVRVDAWARPSRNYKNKTRLYVSVSDTGIGIPDKNIAHVFERFTQSDASFSRSHEGAGLGLAIVKRIIELMSGSISVDSEVGVGTTVYLHLLLDNATEEKSAAPVAPLPANLRPMRILLAEDDPIGAMSTKLMLEKMGHSIVTVPDGIQAIRTVMAENFDCILMDINMPELDGVEATRIIRNNKKFKDKAAIPIIALTAYAMEGDREKFLTAGLDEHVTKPVSKEQLLIALSHIGQRNTSRASKS
jgi:CheY-like chemotaxis protein